MTIQTAIQLTEETFERVRAAANGVGQTPDDFIIEAINEHLEDVEDVKRAEDALKKVNSGEMRTYSLEQVSHELDLDD
jgi:predicted DNA-binding protein